MTPVVATGGRRDRRAAGLAARGSRVAVITGREAEAVVRLSGLGTRPGLLVDGVYGAQRLRDGVLDRLRPRAHGGGPHEVDGVLTRGRRGPGVWVEDKDISFVVHTRQAGDPDAALARSPAGHRTGPAARPGGAPGKQVLEVRVAGMDKGARWATCSTSWTRSALLWAGDDLGDMPAFERVRAGA